MSEILDWDHAVIAMRDNGERVAISNGMTAAAYTDKTHPEGKWCRVTEEYEAEEDGKIKQTHLLMPYERFGGLFYNCRFKVIPHENDDGSSGAAGTGSAVAEAEGEDGEQRPARRRKKSREADAGEGEATGSV